MDAKMGTPHHEGHSCRPETPIQESRPPGQALWFVSAAELFMEGNA